MRNMIKALLVVTLIVPTLAMANIVSSKHDLASNNASATVKATAASAFNQTCAFCHTPHHAKNANTLLLWNRQYSANQTWGSLLNTTNGTGLPQTASAIQAPSQACLSCHDGQTNIGSLLNIGGSASVVPMLGTNANGSMLVASADYIGQSLNGNHPISVPYGVNGTVYNSITSKALTTDFKSVSSSCTGSSFCTTGTGGGGIPLFGASTTTVGIECTSCHDPHQTVNGTFLRLSTTSSSICVACHNK